MLCLPGSLHLTCSTWFSTLDHTPPSCKLDWPKPLLFVMIGKALIPCPVHRPIQDWAHGKPKKVILQWLWDWHGVWLAMLSHIVKARCLGLGVPVSSPIATRTPQQEWRGKEISSGYYYVPRESILSTSMAFRALLLGYLLLCHALLWRLW